MSKSTFIRLCAVSAILAGSLRAIASFVSEAAPKVQILYFFIDVFLLLGIVGLYRSGVASGKLVGVVGFIVTIIALAVLIGRDIGLVPAVGYAAVAGIFALGLDLFAIQALRIGKLPRWVPVGWILSSILGPIGFFLPSLHFLFAVSGLMFGIGFAGAGIAMWKSDFK